MLCRLAHKKVDRCIKAFMACFVKNVLLKNYKSCSAFCHYSKAKIVFFLKKTCRKKDWTADSYSCAMVGRPRSGNYTGFFPMTVSI